jgi:indole-3-glycerol phosphate synthase
MSILTKIGETKKEEVSLLKRERGLASLKEGARSQKAPKDFKGALQRPGKLSLIAELKKASPSKGILRPDFQIEPLAQAYAKGGAQVLSVLTDVQYFQGALANIQKAKDASGLPALRKDFIIDEHQVYEAREANADAILLIVAMLSLGQLKDLQALAQSLGMAVLVEVHDEKELETALQANIQLLGINNRNLNDFTMTLQTSLNLMKNLPSGLPVVSESGIFTREDATLLQKNGASAILVGEAFMTQKDVEAAVRAILPVGA